LIILFIHSGHFYSASSSPLLIKSAPDTARILGWSFTPRCHRQLRVKDLPKVLAWRLARDSNSRSSASTPSMCHHVSHVMLCGLVKIEILFFKFFYLSLTDGSFFRILCLQQQHLPQPASLHVQQSPVLHFYNSTASGLLHHQQLACHLPHRRYLQFLVSLHLQQSPVLHF